jgi:hypothetical protein
VAHTHRKRVGGLLAIAAIGVTTNSTLAGPPDNWQAIILHAPGQGFHSFAYGVSGPLQVGTQNNRAVVWNGTAAPTLLPNPGFGWSDGRGIDGGRMVGEVLDITGPTARGFAALWHSPEQDPVLLHPSWADHSRAFAIKGDQQVGDIRANGSSYPRAALWRGTPGSYVTLHPAGADQSWAYATDGVRQGGSVWTSNGDHAALWNGAAESFVSLNPPGSTWAEVRAMAPGVQVGFARVPGNPDQQAALWRGSAATYLNMNPEGSLRSAILGTNGSLHVGQAWFRSISDAVLWWGDNPNDYVNLHQLLGGGFGSSRATGVHVEGDTVYVTGIASGQGERAVLWIGTIPSPSGAIVMLGGLALLGRRRRTG